MVNCRTDTSAQVFSHVLTGGFGVAPQGSGICSSSVLHGMVFKKEVEGDVTSVKDAKIAVYSCPFDGMITETKVRGVQKLNITGVRRPFQIVR